MPEKLNEESLEGWLEGRSGWKVKEETLVKKFDFPSWRDSIVFVNRLATIADDHEHHPDIDIRYDTVKVMLTTHDVGGLTEKDLAVAEQIDFATSTR